MRNKWCLALAIVIAIFTGPAFADDFTATIDHNGVSVGESLTLQLSLTNAEAKGRPDISPLRELFTIESEGQSSNITYINGHVTNTTNWDLTLIPKKEGHITIPSLTMESSKGRMKTEPIMMDVSHASAEQFADTNKNLTIMAQASTLTPYKNQSVLYTVKIIVRGAIADLNLSEPSIDNAVVEKQGDPKVMDSIENGERVKIIEKRYLITPLGPGKITIPAATLNGKKVDTKTSAFTNPFDQNVNDPFAMMRNMDVFGRFGRLKPFSVASNEVMLDVKPQAVPMDPWLPLTSLAIREDLENVQMVRVGEPLTRKITLTAEGAGGKQLPSLENQQDRTDFNIYADKPITSEKFNGNSVMGERTESYSLIPKKEGKLELPAIKVPWWNLKTDQVEYAQVPARTLDVLPAVGSSTQPVTTANITPEPQATPQSKALPPVQQPVVHDAPKEEPSITYAVIGFLLLVLLIVIVWAISMQRKLKSFHHMKDADKSATLPESARSKESSFADKDFELVKTIQELDSFLRGYASEHYDVRKNASLDEALSALVPHSGAQREMAGGIINGITAALYAGKNTDFLTLKNECQMFLDSLNQPKNDNHVIAEKLQKLNPD